MGFLGNRTQRVVIEGNESKSVSVTSNSPHGAVSTCLPHYHCNTRKEQSAHVHHNYHYRTVSTCPSQLPLRNSQHMSIIITITEQLAHIRHSTIRQPSGNCQHMSTTMPSDCLPMIILQMKVKTNYNILLLLLNKSLSDHPLCSSLLLYQHSKDTIWIWIVNQQNLLMTYTISLAYKCWCKKCIVAFRELLAIACDSIDFERGQIWICDRYLCHCYYDPYCMYMYVYLFTFSTQCMIYNHFNRNNVLLKGLSS